MGKGKGHKIMTCFPFKDFSKRLQNQRQLLPCVWLFDPLNSRPPCASVHEISQARILEWVAISFSTETSPPRDQTQVSCIADWFFSTWATREASPKTLHAFTYFVSSLHFTEVWQACGKVHKPWEFVHVLEWILVCDQPQIRFRASPTLPKLPMPSPVHYHPQKECYSGF